MTDRGLGIDFSSNVWWALFEGACLRHAERYSSLLTGVFENVGTPFGFNRNDRSDCVGIRKRTDYCRPRAFPVIGSPKD